MYLSSCAPYQFQIYQNTSACTCSKAIATPANSTSILPITMTGRPKKSIYRSQLEYKSQNTYRYQSSPCNLWSTKPENHENHLIEKLCDPNILLNNRYQQPQPYHHCPALVEHIISKNATNATHYTPNLLQQLEPPLFTHNQTQIPQISSVHCPSV